MSALLAFGVISVTVLLGLLIMAVRKPDMIDLAECLRQRNHVTAVVTQERDSFLKKQERLLLQSGTGITLQVYYLMIAVSFLVLYLVTDFLLASKTAAVLVGCTAVLVPGYVIRGMKEKKKAEFDEMYVKALKRMASSLRAGSTLLQAVEDIVHTYSLPRAIREEMAAVLIDFEFNDAFEEAFMKMYQRTGSEDVKSTALSIQISSRYGAKLYEALEGYASAIMQRKEMEAEGRAKLSSVSATVTVVSLVPFIFGFLVRLSDPTYFDGLYAYGNGAGRWILLALYAIDVIGYFYLKRKCNIRI